MDAFHVPKNGCVLLKYSLSPIFKNVVDFVFVFRSHLFCLSLSSGWIKQNPFPRRPKIEYPGIESVLFNRSSFSFVAGSRWINELFAEPWWAPILKTIFWINTIDFWLLQKLSGLKINISNLMESHHCSR